MVVMPNLGASQPAEKLFGPIRASAVRAVGAAMIDPLHGERLLKLIPRAGFVRHQLGSFGDPRPRAFCV